MSAQTTAAREAARRSDGRFGPYSLTDPGPESCLDTTPDGADSESVEGAGGLIHLVARGVIDEHAVAAYTQGQCLALAEVLATRLGSTVHAVMPADEIANIGVPGSDWQHYMLHAVAPSRDGSSYLDITGGRTKEQLLADYRNIVGGEFGELALVELNDEAIWSWEEHDETPELDRSVAWSFVDPLLDRAGRQS